MDDGWSSLEVFEAIAPDLCDGMKDALESGATIVEVSHVIDQATPSDSLTNQAAHAYLDSLKK